MKEHSLFDLLVLSLGNAALMGLGLVPEPESNVCRKDLEAAKHNIDLMATLQEKTRGNLSSAEETMLRSLLADLHIKYVAACK